jgi:hypothetical protein
VGRWATVFVTAVKQIKIRKNRAIKAGPKGCSESSVTKN